VSAESDRHRREVLGAILASTEPRSRERGELDRKPEVKRVLVASTEPRSRERGERCTSRCIGRLTGASTEPRSRERGEGQKTELTVCQLQTTLQRSRAHVSAERLDRKPEVKRVLVASTEPRSRERGEEKDQAGWWDQWYLLQRSRAHVSAERSASSFPTCTTASLQRSRAHVSAESPCPWRARAYPNSASTEPRSRERGEKRAGSRLSTTAFGFNGAALT